MKGKFEATLFNPYSDLLGEMAEGSIKEADLNTENITFAFSLLDNSYSEQLSINCRNKLLTDVSRDKVDSFVGVFIKLLSNNRIMTERCDELVERLFPYALERGISVKRLIALMDACPGVWKSARSELRDVYLSSITETIETVNDTAFKEELTTLKETLTKITK